MVSAALISASRHYTAIWAPLSVPLLSPCFSSRGPFSHKLLHDNLVHCAVQLNSKRNHCRTVAKGASCNTFIHSHVVLQWEVLLTDYCVLQCITFACTGCYAWDPQHAILHVSFTTTHIHMCASLLAMQNIFHLFTEALRSTVTEQPVITT